MESNLVVKPMFSAFFWSMLFVSLFCAPVIMAARAADDGARTAELIRQHQEALSPWSSGAPLSTAPGVCEPLRDEPMEQETSMGNAAPDATIIRPVGRRSTRIEV